MKTLGRSAQAAAQIAARTAAAAASATRVAGADAGEQLDDFARRHIGPTTGDVAAMLEIVGVGSVDALIEQTLPAAIRHHGPLGIGAALGESATLEHLAGLAAQNTIATSLIGMGYYDTIVPPVIQRNLLENPAWYTAYTPYQPEISQGRLEAVLNFQTMVCDLTALDVANASLLDEATAAAEAMAMAKRAAKSASRRFWVDAAVHPQTVAVLRTRAEPLGWEIVLADGPPHGVDGECFGALFQYPGTHGHVADLGPAIAAVQARGGVAVVAADPLALTLLEPPGEFGADIAIGSTQRFGVPMGFGGPHAAYIAVRKIHQRNLPGRLVGVSVDANGAPAYRLALQTREQHIRRDKATSNICTAQVLLAVAAGMYAVYHGPEGLTRIAEAIHRRTAMLAAGLRRLGVRILNDTYFDTLTVDSAAQRERILARAREEGLNFRVLPSGACGAAHAIGMSLDETSTDDTVAAILRCFVGSSTGGNEEGYRSTGGTSIGAPPAAGIPGARRRTSSFLAHPVFHRHRSETELLRYLRRLSDRDLALDRTMIPLGSCTMKLNGTAEMMPMTWPGFARIHPYAPPEQTQGYRQLIAALERALCAITGYDAVSLQPNSGAQGEYAGLLAIRAYHRSRGEEQRTVCLIPASAHGTNPASAAMAGMQVIVVRCDANGDVDLKDLAQHCERHASTLAAVMVTYPSTHGVFEEQIRELCALVHRVGGQVYIDGANLNAQVGLARPADYGADVSHLNLHKTFCIPHGGGGPGMGPIGVKAHLTPFLPAEAPESLLGSVRRAGGAVSAAPYGSPSILPIAYAYIRLMGDAGLKRASEIAVLSANYLASRLDPHFPVLYRNAKGRVAHECIIDPRIFKDRCGVTVDDIAKRLIDYGFHAPTMSFPVAGTLMIEPTESESKQELDRFCAAMIAIRGEILDLEHERHALADSPLRRAPHTVRDLVQAEWRRPYSRVAGCLPAGGEGADKYWPPVGRVDNVHGDRNLFCSCPPVAGSERHPLPEAAAVS